MAAKVRVRSIAQFRRCLNCGIYKPMVNLFKGAFCSEECMDRFARCLNCGSYFTKGVSDSICSEECQTEYKLERRGISL